MKKTTIILIAATFVFFAVSTGSAFAQCPFGTEGTVVTAENLDNGAVLSVTSEDAEVVTTLQEIFAEHTWERVNAHFEDATVLPELADNGFTLTITSENAETVTAIQAFAEQKVAGEGCGHGDGVHGDHAEGSGGCPRHQAEPEPVHEGGCGPDCNCGHHNAVDDSTEE